MFGTGWEFNRHQIRGRFLQRGYDWEGDKRPQIPVHPNSQLSDRMAAEHFCDHHDHFENTTPNSEYKTCLAHAEKIGLGTREYELIFMK